MLSLDDEWFDSVLKACYHNPRAERERRRRSSQLNSVCSLHTEDYTMGKPQKKADGSKKSGDESGASRKSTPATRSTGKGSRRATPDSGKPSPDLGKRNPRHRPPTKKTKDVATTSRHGHKEQSDDFDIEYAIKQSHLMFTMKDDRELTRALFKRDHPDVNGANIMKVGERLGLRITTEYLVYIGVIPETCLKTPPTMVRTTTISKGEKSSSKSAGKTTEKSGDTVTPLPSQKGTDGSVSKHDCRTSYTPSMSQFGGASHTLVIDRPKDHKSFENLLPGHHVIGLTSWRQVWRDDMRSWELGTRDLDALMLCAEAETFTFKVVRKQHEYQYTLFPMCGHVSHGPDYHVVCRQCELLSRGSFCCRTEKTRCDVGKRMHEVDSAYMTQVVVSRKTTKDGVSHRGNYVQIEHCGNDAVLPTSVLARISFALGAGAECLRSFVDSVVANANEVQLPTAKEIKTEWDAKGKEAGVTGLAPRRTIRILARSLMTATAQARHADIDAPPTSVTAVTTPSTGMNRREILDASIMSRHAEDDDDVYLEDTSSTRSTKRMASRDSNRSSKNPRLADTPGEKGKKTNKSSKKWRQAAATAPQLERPRGMTPLSRDMFRVEDTLCLHIPISDGGVYVDNVADASLHLNLDDHVPKRIGERRDARLQISGLEAGNLPLHPTVVTALARSDEMRAAAFPRLTVTPPQTTDWDLPSSSSRFYTSTIHAVSAKPPPLPEQHIPATPVSIQRDTLLPVSYEALTAQEHLCGTAVHELSAVKTEVDNVRGDIIRLLVGGATVTTAAIEVEVDGVLATLAAAMERCVGATVDALQAAAYHRRWALTCGAPNSERNVLLRAPLVGASNAVGVSDTKADISSTGTASTTLKPCEGSPIVIELSSSGEDDDTEKKTVNISDYALLSPLNSSNPFVNQGSPASIFDDISISNISPVSESKLIQNLSEFLSFE